MYEDGPEFDKYLDPESDVELIFAMDNLLNSSVSVSEVTKSYVDST
jgi:hypothetical protein